MKTTQTQKERLGRSRLKSGQSRLRVSRSTLQKNKFLNERSIIDLFLGLLFLLLLALMITEFSPNDLVNIVLVNSYLPCLLLLFFSLFFLIKFILPNQRLVFCLVFNLILLLFFYLQNLTFNYYLFIILSLPPLIWTIINQIEKRLL